MGNKHGTLSLGRCRDKHRPDTRSRNWSFHSMDSRRVGSTSKSRATSSVSIHTSGGQSYVKYQARSSSTTRSGGAAAASNRALAGGGGGRAGLVARSLSAPAQDGGSDDSLPETDNSACVSSRSRKPVCLAESDPTIHKIALTPLTDALPVDLERYQPGWDSTSTALEDPWVRRSGRFEASTDSTSLNTRQEPSCRRKLFDDTTRESSRDSVAASASSDSLAKHKMRITFSKNRSKNNGVLKTNRDEKDVINHNEGTDKTAADLSSHRVQAFSYLSKLWNERLKSSSNRLRSKNREHRTCASQSELAKLKSTNESRPAHTLSSDRSEKASSGEPQVCPPPGERVAHFLTNLKGHTGIFAKKKIFSKNSVKNTRLYKSSETIINKSTGATVKETNEWFETQVNRDVLPISTSELSLTTSDCAVSLVTKKKYRNLSSSSADGLQFSENLGAKPPKNPFHRGLISSGTSTSISSLHSEPNNARRIRRQLGVNSSALDSQTQDERDRRISQKNRRSLQCFSLNLDTFTEESVDGKPASRLDIALDQITNRAASTRDIITDRHPGNSTSQSNQFINGAQTINIDKSNTLFSPCGNQSTQAQITTEIGKLNSTRGKLNLPVGRNVSGKRCDKKPIQFSSPHRAESSLSFAMSNLTTTPTTTDSGYNTESSFSCEKTPRIAKVFDSPISEILYYNVDEEDFEETCSLTRYRSSDNIENIFQDNHSRCNGVEYDPNVENLKTPAGEEANRDSVTRQAGRKTTELFLEEMSKINGEAKVKTRTGDLTRSAYFNQEEWRDFSRQMRDWQLGFAKSGQINGNVTVTDTVKGTLLCDVSCDGFETNDVCDVNVCLKNDEIEEMKSEAIVERNVYVSQSRDMHVCDDQNINSGTSGNEHLNGKYVSLPGDNNCTTQGETNLKQQGETNDTQEDTQLAKQEINSQRRKEILQEVTNYRKEDKNLTRQEEMNLRRQEEINCTVNVKKSVPIPEHSERILSEMCHGNEDFCDNHNISTIEILASRKLNQEKRCENRNRKEGSENNHTDSTAAQSLVYTIRHFVRCNNGNNHEQAVSSADIAITNNGGYTFDECISSPTGVSQVKVLNAQEDKTETNGEDVYYVNENDNEMCPLIAATSPVTDDSSMGNDVRELCNNGGQIELFTSQNYCSNAGENSPPNGTRQDREAVFSRTNGERKGGNVVTEEQDQSTKDNSTYVCCSSSRGGNCRVCSGDGGVGNISRQTSRDTDQEKGLSGELLSRSLANRDNCSALSIISCDDVPVSLSVSFLREQLQNKTACCNFKEDRDITTANSTALTEELSILDSAPSNHDYSQIDHENVESSKDVFRPTVVCDEESVSTNSLPGEFADIDGSWSFEWRGSTSRSREQTSSLCLENLARCIEGICGASSQEQQMLGSSRTSTPETSGKDFSCDTFIGNRNQADSSARFFKEQSQPNDCAAIVKEVDQKIISNTHVDKLRQCNISGSFTENADQSISSGKLTGTLSQPVILERFTEKLSQSNNNTCIEKLGHDENHGASVDNLTKPDISDTVVKKSNQTTTSDAPKKRGRHLHRALSVSDSNLSDALFNQALKAAAAKKPPKPRKRLAFGSTEVHEKYESSPSGGDLLYPLNEVNSHNGDSTMNYVASDYNLYFSDNMKNRGQRSDACGSKEMLKSYHYNDNVDYNVDGSYSKKVASCSNLVEHRSRYRSRIAMGLTSARMRSCASPARHPCMEPSLRMAHSASPISSNISPEKSTTSESSARYSNLNQTCLMGNSRDWRSAVNTGGLQQDLPAPNTFVTHSRSLDMCTDRDASAVHVCGHAPSLRVSEIEDRPPGRFHTSGERRSSERAQRYLSEPDDLSCFAGYRQDQLPLTSAGNEINVLTSSTFDMTTINTANGVHTSPPCLNQPNLDSGNPYKNSQIVCGKDSTKSGFCHSYHIAANNKLSPTDLKHIIDTPPHGTHFTQFRNGCVISPDSILTPDYSNLPYSGESLPPIDSHSNHPPTESNNRAASVSSDVINSHNPSWQLQQDYNVNIDPISAAMATGYSTSPVIMEYPAAMATGYSTSPVLMESPGLRHSHIDRVWDYSMTSLLEAGTSADVWCVEADPVMEAAAMEVCPTCHRPFDSGRKRRLIDSCGHERCYTCMFNSEICSVCVRQAQAQISASRATGPPSGYPPRSTLNHPLTDNTAFASDPPEIPPRLRLPAAPPGVLDPPSLPTKAKHSPPQGVSHQRGKQSPVHYSNQSLTAPRPVGCKSPVTMETLDLHRESDSPPPPPPDVAQHDLMMRLGLLLGDPIHPSGVTGVGVVLPGHQYGEDTLNSISSLSSNEHTPDRLASDASPMSTLTASIPSAREDMPMFGSRRNASVRRSARVSVNGRRSELRATKSDFLQLKPLVFEVPHPEGKPIFVGRAWLFSKLEAVFGADSCGAPRSNGVIITGAQGTGKTAIVEQLINHSCFSDDHTGCNSARSHDQHPTNASNSTKLTDYTALNGLGFQVVAYHVCQADHSATCMVADMVSSMAAQMAKAPQLVAYRELLLQEPHLQGLLSITECTQNPSLSFLKGTLEPLQMLKTAGKIFTDCCLILVDSLNEAEFHKPDHGDTIASFLCRHASKLPDWLKLVVTVQSSFQEITSSLPFSRISLDQHGNSSDRVSRDIVSYIDHRISISSAIRANIAVNGRPNKELTAKFTSHVHNLSSGSFLYAKMVLDLIENGHLIPKSSSYTILPVNLSEVFLLHFNLKFSSVRAFERVSAILAVCLASLYPLTLVDVFLTVNSGYVHQYLSWEDFSQRMDVLAGFVYSCHDNTVMFFHPAFREWLIHRNEGDSPKFICDLRHGHALMAFRLSRVSAPLSPDKTIELGHHILKAHIYKSVSRQLGYSSQNLQAYWMCLSSHSLNAALVSHRNVYSPNVKVSRLILLSGGNPNSRTEYLNNAPVLCVAAREGYIDMLSLLLEFGADPNVTSDTGMTPLCHGAAGGHVEVMRMLCLHSARPSAQDAQGHSAAIHAVLHGQLEAVKFLMHLNWTVHPDEPAKDEVITQCFVAAAATGNTQILDYLHQTYNGSRLNMVDSLLSETALTAACLHGRTLCVKFLLDSGADVRVPNARFLTPLLCAVKCGCWEVCDVLLASGADLEMTDQYGCTALMMAAREGHTALLTFLLDKGASQISTDKQGLTGLCWACLQGHLSIVESLVVRGSDVNHSDVHGRCPLHLAAMYGDINVIQFLIDHKAHIEHTDRNGMRALDFAIVYNNMAVIICFLRKGAKLGPNTWNLAAEKTDILLLLLNKLIEDGHILYKKNRIKEASQRYQYALKKLPIEVRSEEVQTFQELKLSFLLNLSRCKRRMNDLQSAIDLATKALEVRPKCFEAYYARARARRDNRQYAAAQQDLVEALHLAPKNRELQRLLTRVKEECWEQMARYESGGGREAVHLEMGRIDEDRIAEDDNDSLIVDNPVLYLPAV